MAARVAVLAAGETVRSATQPDELDICPLLGTDFVATDDVALTGPRDRAHDAVLTGNMDTYVWRINGAVFGNHTPLPVSRGEGVRLRWINQTMMPHPLHLHGHTFQVVNGDGSLGPRKDTAILPAGRTLDTYFVADNPGAWVAHCHNDYHMVAGMMTTVEYTG